MDYVVRRVNDADREWVRAFITDQWSDESIVVHGSAYFPHTLDGFLAITSDSEPVGLLTYVIKNSACEIVTLNSIVEGEGIGSALVRAVQREAIRSGCSRVWCVTTNDNFPALIFYQKIGFRIVRIYPRAVERARLLKPSIPLYGLESIPIRDEIELEMESVAISSQ
jgi:GNAT superfamily N-acetyltransferase